MPPGCSGPFRPQVPLPSQSLRPSRVPSCFHWLSPGTAPGPAVKEFSASPLEEIPCGSKEVITRHPNHTASGGTKEISGPASLGPKPGSAASAWGGYTHREGL